MQVRPGPYEQLRTERIFDALDRLADAASHRNTDTAALAIAWLLAQPQVTAVVVGPRRPEHLEPSVRALELDLSHDDAGALAALFE